LCFGRNFIDFPINSGHPLRLMPRQPNPPSENITATFSLHSVCVGQEKTFLQEFSLVVTAALVLCMALVSFILHAINTTKQLTDKYIFSHQLLFAHCLKLVIKPLFKTINNVEAKRGGQRAQNLRKICHELSIMRCTDIS
jgi:hypothetical protein